jgi:hypothetical protein
VQALLGPFTAAPASVRLTVMRSRIDWRAYLFIFGIAVVAIIVAYWLFQAAGISPTK